MRPRNLDVLVAVATGGALGAVARYALEVAWPVPAGGFPWVTLLVNVTGCAALGAVMELLAELSAPPRLPWPAHRPHLVRPFLGTGVLGGFTTFSAYAVDARELLAAGRPGLAAGYVAVTLVAALAAVWAGMMGVRLVARRRP